MFKKSSWMLLVGLSLLVLAGNRVEADSPKVPFHWAFVMADVRCTPAKGHGAAKPYSIKVISNPVSYCQSEETLAHVYQSELDIVQAAATGNCTGTAEVRNGSMSAAFDSESSAGSNKTMLFSSYANSGVMVLEVTLTRRVRSTMCR